MEQLRFNPNLSVAVNFVVNLNNKYLLFNIFSILSTIIIIILILVLANGSFAIDIFLYLFVIITIFIFSKIEKKMHNVQYIMKLIDSDIKRCRFESNKGRFVEGIYFLIRYDGFMHTNSFEERHTLQHHLIKKYIKLMDVWFIVSYVKLIQSFKLSDYDKEFNDIITNHVFEKIQNSVSAKLFIQANSDWFDSSSIPMEQRKYYQKIIEQSP